jgi:hypothetical protein
MNAGRWSAWYLRRPPRGRRTPGRSTRCPPRALPDADAGAVHRNAAYDDHVHGAYGIDVHRAWVGRLGPRT